MTNSQFNQNLFESDVNITVFQMKNDKPIDVEKELEILNNFSLPGTEEKINYYHEVLETARKTIEREKNEEKPKNSKKKVKK
jgi:hypothetical protein